jgi:glycosyltransferase involved in cell wall biosynthesis
MNFNSKINVYFSWTELPHYGYSLLKYLDHNLKINKLINFRVISNPNSFQKNYKENNNFYKKIIWIKKNNEYSWDDLGLETPNIFFQSGWGIKSFNYLGKLVKLKNKNNIVILGVDNSLQKNNIRQFVGALYFKIFLKKNFDYAVVPGISSKRLMIKFGFKQDKIFKGVYCALQNIYNNNVLPQNRKKQFLYVGQFIYRKNILRLVSAFKNANIKKKKWKLILVGDGSLKIKEKNLGCDIKIIKRLTPKKLSKLYNESLFFILPSLREHWGLVVHEASLSGCFLLLSNNIGSTYEFSNKKNSFIFNPLNINSIQKAIEDSMILNNKKLITGNKESERLGNYHNYNNFYEHIKIIINNYLIKNSLSYAVVK